jgi:hypothetical protein
MQVNHLLNASKVYLKKNKKNAKIFFQSLCNESLEAQNEAEK